MVLGRWLTCLLLYIFREGLDHINAFGVGSEVWSHILLECVTMVKIKPFQYCIMVKEMVFCIYSVG